MGSASKRYSLCTIEHYSVNHIPSIFASTPFKFVIEDDTFYIHQDLVSQHSKPLDRLMNGSMTEAQNGFAVLEDVDADTFIRFTQWAYRGYYSAASISTQKESSHDPCEGRPHVCGLHEESGEADPGVVLEMVEAPLIEAEYDLPAPIDTYWGLSSKKSKHSKKIFHETEVNSSQQRLKEDFIKRKYTSRQASIRIPPPVPNRKPSEDYTETLLSHVRVYVFAEKFDIHLLRRLALEELHATLATFTLHRVRTRDIIELLRYSYANTSDKEGEEMRAMLTQYIGYEMDTLIKDTSFTELLIEDGGALLANFLEMVGKRI